MRRNPGGRVVVRRPRLPALAAIGASLLVVALVLYAARDDPVLSPDSIAYLSVAQHLRAGRGFVDFTGEPMTVFGPIYPLLLTPGGRGLVWAAIVGALCAGSATSLMFLLLRRSTRAWAAVAGAAAFGASQGLLRVSATAWSEAPYAAVSIATLLVLSGRRSTRRAAAGGLLAGLGFLTRYAGMGLVASGGVMVLAASHGDGRRVRSRRVGAYVTAALAVGATWVVRNLVVAGDALGPRSTGGSPDPTSTLLRRPLIAMGQLVLGLDRSRTTLEWVGASVAVALVAAAVVVAWRRPWNVADVGVIAFGVTSIVVPVMARATTASDLEWRVMSPMLVPIVYLAARVLDRRARAVAGVGLALGAWWALQGVSLAQRFPDSLAGSAGNRQNFAPRLYDLVAALPPSATVLTDSTHRMWWHSHHDPVLFAFVVPRAGNSHYPISPEQTLAAACRPDTYLAWVDEPRLVDDSPLHRRPDLAAVVRLTLVEAVPGGELYRVTPVDPSRCPSGDGARSAAAGLVDGDHPRRPEAVDAHPEAR